VIAKRSQTIRRINDTIQRRYGNIYRVEVFGSTIYGVDHADSDLDLVIMDSERMTGFASETLTKNLPGTEVCGCELTIYSNRGLGATLKRAGFRILGSVPRAMVPIVKFMDPDTGLQCDINVNDQLGLINSGLIKWYCDMFPNLRPLIKTIKSWAKPLGLNEPGIRSQQTSFSSYALTMMTIGLLQSRGLLPNLQSGVSGDPGADDVFWLRTRGSAPHLEVDIRWNKINLWDSRPVELDELVLDWFKFYGYEYSFRLHAVSVRHGGIIVREKPPLGKADLEGVVPFSGQPQYPGIFGKVREQKEKGGKKSRAQTGNSQERAEESKGSPTKIGPDETASQSDLQSSSNLDDDIRELAIGEAEDGEEGGEEEAEEALEGYGQPEKWFKDAIVVGDPFILSKVSLPEHFL
ncbi:hypothetical protein OF83DRAFT_1063840, partial [Amylostereum chailletii]